MFCSPRTTKAQKKFIINYLDSNRIIRIQIKLLGGKINPCELPKVNKLWKRLKN